MTRWGMGKLFVVQAEWDMANPQAGHTIKNIQGTSTIFTRPYA